MKKPTKKKIMEIGSALLALFILGAGIFAYASQQVEIEVSQMPNVDIILTKSQTQVDLQDFEKNLKAELVTQNVMSQAEIDSGKVNVSAVDTQTVETQESFNWQQSVSSAIGSVSFQNNGKDVVMAGNTRNAGKNAIWIIPEGNQEQDFNFTYNIDYGDSFNAAGMLLRVQENANNTLEGYMISFNNRGAFSTGSNASLWHFVYDKVNSRAFRLNTDIQLIANLSIQKSGNLSVKVNDTSITINGGGLTSEYVYQFKDGESYGEGYGFFSDHYSHGCSQIGSFKLTNINLQTETVKKFTEVLQAPDWRDGSLRILVNVEDKENEQFSDPDELTAIIAKLMNNDVYYIGWGTDENSEQIKEVIEKNDHKGTYIANSSDDAIQATVEYIKKIIKPNVSNTIIAGEPVNVKITSPSSGTVETPTDAYPNGVWKVVHDDQYYENPQNQYELNNMYSNDLIQSFDNVGKYSIYCEDKFVTEIYAHRRPVAAFDMQVVGNQVNLQSNSYDLDIERDTENTEEQKANNGIKVEKWQYKNATAENAEWVDIDAKGIGEEVTATLEENTQYMIRLIVTDYQGIESTAIKYITTGEATLKPIASYKVTNKVISMYEQLEVIDESYDPSGMPLTYQWTVTKGDETVYTGDKPLVDFSTTADSKYGIGTYKMTLVVSKVVEGETISSDAFSQTIEVVEDNTPPAIIVDPTTAETQNEEIHISVNLRDGESGLKSYQYAFTKDINEITEEDWSEEMSVTGNVADETITLSREFTDQELYLHVKATNQDGTVSKEKVTGPYYINPYILVLQIVDRETGRGVEGARYNIIGEKENGQTVEIMTDGQTDRNGKITVQKAKLKDITSIKVENTQEVTGYEKSEYKTIKIDATNSQIVVDDTESSYDVETQVSEDGQTLNIKVPVDRIKFELGITNIDSQSKNLLSGTEFVLKQNGTEITRGTTEDGILKLTAPIAGSNLTQEYVLEQTKIGEQYTGIGATYLRITFDENGQIRKIQQKAFVENDAVTIEDETKPELIIQNERKDDSKFQVQIHVADYENNENLGNSQYKIKVEGENELNYTTQSAYSDESGNIVIDGLYGTGLLKLTFIHEEAPNGYKVESVDRYITIQREANGAITYNEASMSGVFQKAEKGVVYVELKNTKKASTNAIKIKILSEDNNEIGIEGIGVKIYKLLDNSLIGSGTTDENGYIEILNVQNDGVGEVLYKAVFDNDVLDITPIFVIEYNKARISNAYQMSSIEDVNISYSEDDDEDFFKYVANIQIHGALDNLTGDNTLTIKQQSKEEGRAIEGAQYKIRMTASDSIHTDVLTTNEEGKVQTNLFDDKNVTIQITQTKAAEGYQLDDRTKTILLTKNSNGIYQINSVSNIDASQITIDDRGNVSILEECYSNKNTAVTLQIAKTDLNNSLSLGGFKFRVTEETTGYEEEITTTSSGYIALGQNFIATEGKSYVLQIEEIESVAPYKILETPIKVEIRFTKDGEIVSYNGISYLQGNEYLSSKVASYDSQENQLTISLKVINTVDPNLLSGILYDLDIIKVNKQGETVSGSKYDIEVRPYAESSIIRADTTINDEIEISNLAIKQEKTTILLKETNPAIGYGLDSQIKVVTLQMDENGNLVYLTDTTSSDITINIVDKNINGISRKVVEITITAKDASEEEQPTYPTYPNLPGDEEERPAEERPENATVAFKVFNKSYGDWTKTYRSGEYYLKYGFSRRYGYFTRSYKLDSAQKLERIFKDTSEAQNYGFNFMTGADITLEARLVSDGVVSNEVYETVKARENTNINDVNGTDSIYLYNDYANKTVEFTMIENVPAYNYKRNTTDAKFILTFDANGKVKSGEITQGNDTEDFAIGGISAQGIVDNIKYLSTQEHNKYGQVMSDEYVTGDIKDYNTIGQDTVYFGLLNKAYSNPFEIQVNLKDFDTDDGLDGEISAIVTEKVGENEYKALSCQTLEIKEGIGTIKLSDTYANRTLRVELLQISNGRKGNISYSNDATVGTQFEVTFDDDANVKELNNITIPDNVTYEGAGSNRVEYTIYNTIIYNFAINVQKLNENGEPLSGVRIQTESYYITDQTMGTGAKIFTYGSAKTDENGNVKLKIVLPETGAYKYSNSVIDVVLKEYYVPDNYKAVDGIKIRILFNGVGTVKDTQIISDYTEGNTEITGINQIETGEMENSSINIKLQNYPVEAKPVMQITNMDSEDSNIKLNGTKYKVSVWDENEYTEENLAINEIRYSNETEENGETKIYFENAHALRTMIYRIEEIQSAESYRKNNDILVRVVYDKDGKIARQPEILTQQTIYVANKGNTAIAQVEGNPIGDTLFKLNIINELKPAFTIRVNKSEANGSVIFNNNIFKGVSQIKSDDGNYQEAQEERISLGMIENNGAIEFKEKHINETVLYTVYEQTGDTYTERGKIEVTFDEYGNVANQTSTGKYITRTTFGANSNYVTTYIRTEIFQMSIQMESKEANVLYSLNGYTFDIVNSKGEHSNINTKTNTLGNVIEIVGEVYKGETITYEINPLTNAIDYEPAQKVELTVVFDEDGNITSCTPTAQEGIFDLITTVKDEDYINMAIKMYVEASERTTVDITVQDDKDPDILVQDVVYNVTVQKDNEYIILAEEGIGDTDVGSYQNYKNQTITYTLSQVEVNEKYMINDSDIQVSVTYDDKGIITDARLVASDGYVTIDVDNTIGSTNLKLITKNRVKTKMQVYNISNELETDELPASTFKIIQKDKSDLYSDTKATDAEGRAQLYVGPYYLSEEVTYKITNPTPAFGFDKMTDAEFTLTYDEEGKVIEAKVPANAQEYLSIEIPERSSEYYGETDIIIQVKSQPLLTIGVEAIDEKTNNALVGGKYEIRQVNKNTNTGTVITQSEKMAHASIGKTEAGQTIVYEMIERGAPLGYKYKAKDQVIGTIQISYDGEGHIIQGSPTLLSGYEYISIKQDTDKPANYDVDLQITYEEIEEFNVIIENENMIDNTDKIQSTFNGQLATGVNAQTTTDPDTGLGILEFGKITATNSRQTLTISQSNIQGSYSAIANIRMSITFDESGKVKNVSTISGASYATPNVTYIVEQAGEYTIKIRVKNNPVTSIHITNVSDGDSELAVNGTYELTGTGITDKISLTTEKGAASTILSSVPKNRVVNYVFKQTRVDRGYTLNKDIIITVHYDNDGKITSAYQKTSSSTADSSVIGAIRYDAYQLDIQIKNKQQFEIYVDTQDAFKEDTKLPGMTVFLKEASYSKKSVNITTDENGEASTILGSTMADRYLDYQVKVLTTPTGYDNTIQKNTYTVRVHFGSNGNIIKCESNSDLIQVNYGSGLAVEITVKYVPTLNMQINRTNTSTNTALAGRKLVISSGALVNGSMTTTTNAQGKVSIDAGRISRDTTVVYTISEQKASNDTNFETLPTMTVNVTYDRNGNIANVETSDNQYITATPIGDRDLSVEIGSKKLVTVSVVNSDYYNHTVYIGGKYEITSDKGEKSTISSTTGISNVIAELGKVYSGEKITYTIHQIGNDQGYEVVEDQSFTVEYNLDGTIGKVESANTDRLIIQKVNQNNSKTQANIQLQIYSKATLDVKLKVTDKLYNSGVYGLGFKIKNEETGIETSVDAKTDDNGILTIPVPPTYENKNIKYTITQTQNYGGYKAIEPIEFIVSYGNLGTINENGTYIINPQNENITAGYSETLYKNARRKGIQIEIKAETQMGIGIEKVDVYGNKINGIEYVITAKEDNNTQNWRAVTNADGELATYIGDMPTNKVVEYTISELQSPAGYRKIEDAIVKVYYDSEGRISSYAITQQPANATIEIATDNLSKMATSKESVHLKLRIVNDDRVTFRIVNQDSNTQKPIVNSSFNVSVEGEDGTITSQMLNTDAKGQITLENIQAYGEITLYFNQMTVPNNYSENPNNSGFLKINKATDEYKLTYIDGTDNLNYTMDNELGIVTIYLKNDNNLILNIADIDSETMEPVYNGSHTIKAQYGTLEQTPAEILEGTDNILLENGPINSVNATMSISLGNTYQLANKKVVYTISTPITPDKEEEKYEEIKDQYVVVEFDEEGFIKNIKGDSSRVETATNTNPLTMNVVIGFGNIDNYKIKIVKEAEENKLRVNGATFDMSLNVNGANVENFNEQVTDNKTINGMTIEEGVIELKKLNYEGKIQLSLTETKAPEGYEGMLNVPIEVSFDIQLDKTDTEDVKIQVQNYNVNSQNATISVNETTREITITVINKPVFKVEVHKVDEYGNQLVGMKFNMRVQEKEDLSQIIDYGTLTTSEEGTIQAAIDAKYVGKSIFITLTEEKDENYQQIAPITIEAYINEKGKIETANLVSGSENAKITEKNVASIKMEVTNKLEEYVKPYEIDITKTNENDENLRIADVLFQVKVTPDVGTPIYKAVLTDKNGEINLEGLIGSGNIVIELREITAPEGYELGDNEGFYRYEIKKENDVLELVSSNVEEDLLNIDNHNKVVDIKVPNKTELVGIAINKVDENDLQLNIANTTFELTEVSSGEKYTATTDNKGIAYFGVPRKINETSQYTLKETNASEGYQLDETQRNINIQFDGAGNIGNVSEEDGLEIMDKNDKYIRYALTNKQTTLGVEPYAIKIVNIDENNHAAIIPNAEFNVKISQTLGAKYLETTKTTDANGAIEIQKVNGAGEIEIELENTVAGSGYDINNDNMKVKMNRNETSGNIKIVETQNVEAEYDEENNTIIIYVTSEVEVNKYSLVVNVMDETTEDFITDSNGQFNIKLNGNNKTVTANNSGQVILQGLTIPDIDKFEISIEETTAPTGYEQISEAQQLTVNVTKAYDSRVLYNVEIKEGDKTRIVSATEKEIMINLLHNPEERSEEELYLTSDVYRVTDDYVERISNARMVKDYLSNMNSNGEMKVYDQDGNELGETDYVGTGMTIVATKGEEKITKTLSVVGDVTGDGQIKALDISIMKQYIIGKRQLEGAYFLAADITDDGEIKALDISKEKQAIIGKITL